MPSADLDLVRCILLQGSDPLETFLLYGPQGPQQWTSHRDTYAFLSTCCLVSRDWYGVASPLLYSTIILSSYDEAKQASSILGIEALMTSLRHHPSLLAYVQTISARWNPFATRIFLEQPHKYLSLTRLGSLTVEWWNQEGSIALPKVVSLANRFPSLVELRVNMSYSSKLPEDEDELSYLDLRPPSLRLPSTLKKLAVAGPDGFLFLDALTHSPLPQLVELEIETFGRGDFRFFTHPECYTPFIEKVGKQLVSLTVSHRRVDPERFSFLGFLNPQSNIFPLECPALFLAACPSLRTFAFQGLSGRLLLAQGHPNLETLIFGKHALPQPAHILSDVELAQHVDLYNSLRVIFLKHFNRSLFPSLRTIQVASLDFRQRESRDWITVKVVVPILAHHHGLRLVDHRGVEWVDTSVDGSFWPADLLDPAKAPRKIEPFSEEDSLYKQGIVYDLARSLLADQEDGEEDEEEEAEEAAEEPPMPPAMKAHFDSILPGLLADLRQAVEKDMERINRKKAIIEEKDLSDYAD